MELPKSIRVLHYDLEVVTPDSVEMDHNEVEGRFLQSRERIEVRGDRPRSLTQETLFHEVLHAVMCLSGARAILDMETEVEEKLISGLAPALLLALRDNPDLTDFLLD